MKKYWYFILAGFLVLWACSSDNSDETPMADDDVSQTDDDGTATFARGAMLANWADNIIIPSYESFQTSLSSFKSEFDTFKGDPTEANLVNLRSSWVIAYKSWQKVSMFETGPALDVDFRLNMNTYPTDIQIVEDNVSSGSYNLSLPSSRDLKGFPAIDYLLNGLGGDDVAITAKYTTSASYMNYLEDVISDMETLTGAVVNGWKNEYRDTFVNNDGSSATASVDIYVNDFIFYYEKFLRAGKMGIPLGVFSGSVTPNTLEARYMPEIGKDLFLEGLDAVQDFFNGKHFDTDLTGESLASYLQDLGTLKDGEQLDQLINDQLNVARTGVSDLGTFKDEIENNNPPLEMLAAYDEVQRVVTMLKVDMVSAMSISIDFVDADGD